MKILMVSSECYPYAKTGGLADVVHSLSRELDSRGMDVRIVIPRYSSVDTGNLSTESVTASVSCQFGDENISFEYTHLPESRVRVYFLIHSMFTDRSGMYGEGNSGSYRDNHRRFILFNRSVFALCRETGWIPDIIHVHDWQAALVPAYVKTGREEDIFNKTKTVLTIHNIGYQGIFSKHDILASGIPWNLADNRKAGYRDFFNFLKTGILNADAITTVSPTYAEEILTPEFGEGLENYLSMKKDKLTGILNGADYTEWNPETDPYIPSRFSRNNMENKKNLKTVLKKKFGLPHHDEAPLIGIVSRLVSQKGFYELCDEQNGALRCILRDGKIQIVILGTGEEWIEKSLLEMRKEYRNLGVIIGFDNSLAHLIEAGSDFFLMPSRYEPCGLNQIYSLKYGTIPIVSNTGGLSDTVKDSITGFYIQEQTPGGICTAVQKAAELWYNRKEETAAMIDRGMAMDFSWEKSAKKYINLYSGLTLK